MCTAKLLKSPTCNHWWAEILKSCGEGKNFGNCPSFADGRARLPRDHPRYKAEKKTCPKCDKKDDYDGDKIRIIKGVQYDYKIGTGPSKSDRGFDLHADLLRPSKPPKEQPTIIYCCVVM